MRIAYLFGSLNRGGLEILMLDVLKNLKASDFYAYALYRKDGILRDEFEKTKVPLKFIPVGKNILGYLLKLRKYLISNKIDIVHAQQPLDAVFAYFATIGTPIKLMLTLHGFGLGKDHLRQFILKRTVANVYVSQFQKEYYEKTFNLTSLNQNVIYNGIDFSKMTKLKLSENNSLRDEIGIDRSKVLMGMVGNFNPGRNQIFLCRFFKMLKDNNVDFHFVFVGKRVESSPERYDACVKYCEKNNLSENVSFLGVRNDVPEILNQLDAFIYATEHDTFGIAVVEAISAGVPVFVNDWDVMKEVTEDGKLATLYKTNNENDLLQKFMLFLQDKEKYRIQAKENAEIVKRKYSIEQYITNLKTLYQSLV